MRLDTFLGPKIRRILSSFHAISPAPAALLLRKIELTPNSESPAQPLPFSTSTPSFLPALRDDCRPDMAVRRSSLQPLIPSQSERTRPCSGQMNHPRIPSVFLALAPVCQVQILIDHPCDSQHN